MAAMDVQDPGLPRPEHITVASLTVDGTTQDASALAQSARTPSSVRLDVPLESETVNLVWKDLFVSVGQGGKKVLLNGVSGSISEGFYAVMGPSGR